MLHSALLSLKVAKGVVYLPWRREMFHSPLLSLKVVMGAVYLPWRQERFYRNVPRASVFHMNGTCWYSCSVKKS